MTSTDLLCDCDYCCNNDTCKIKSPYLDLKSKIEKDLLDYQKYRFHAVITCGNYCNIDDKEEMVTLTACPSTASTCVDFKDNRTPIIDEG